MKKIKASNKDVDILVDDEDFEKLVKYSWCIVEKGFVRARVNGKKMLIHRFILNLTPYDPQVDHIDHNRLNNCKSNLRLATNQQNQRNTRKPKGNYTSRFKGVHFSKRRGKWLARIFINKKAIYLGYYDNEEDAARAYNIAAITKFGEFACLNDVDMSIDIPDVHRKKTSIFRGVSWDFGRKKWCGKIYFKGRLYYLGWFEEELQAAKAYNDAAIMYHGSKAVLNEIEDE